jgi:hypothetical protein
MSICPFIKYNVQMLEPDILKTSVSPNALLIECSSSSQKQQLDFLGATVAEQYTPGSIARSSQRATCCCDLALGYSGSEGSPLIPAYSWKEDDCTVVFISPIWTESYSTMAFHFHGKLFALPDKRSAHTCYSAIFICKGCVIMLVLPIQSSNEQAHGNKLPKLW